jgi:hypothetical protein
MSKGTTSYEGARLALHDYNSNIARIHPENAVFSPRVINCVTTFEASTAKFDLNLEWFHVGSTSIIMCEADLEGGQEVAYMDFFFRDVRDFKFTSSSRLDVLNLELQFVCKKLSQFVQEKGCNGVPDEKTIHFLTVKLKVDSEEVADIFMAEFLERCRVSPFFATPKNSSFRKSEVVQSKISTKKKAVQSVKNPMATNYSAFDLSPTLPIRNITSKENSKSPFSLIGSTTTKIKSSINGNKGDEENGEGFVRKSSQKKIIMKVV